MEGLFIIYLLFSLVGTICFFAIGKWILGINGIKKEQDKQTALLALIAEKLAVQREAILKILNA